MNLHPGCGCTAMAGTAETPIPAETMARIVANWPLSNTMLGDILNLSHAAIRLSRKQWPSFKRRNGSRFSCARLIEERDASAVSFRKDGIKLLFE